MSRSRTNNCFDCYVNTFGLCHVRNKTHDMVTRIEMYIALLQFRNYFIIRFWSYYLTWDLLQGKIVLQDDVNKSMPFGRHMWILDMQPDGTFTMVSSVNNKWLLSNKDNTLVCSHASSDDSQLWRREGNFIKSEKTQGYLGYDSNQTFPVGVMSNKSVSRPDHEYATLKGHPSLAISCNAIGGKQHKYECATNKVVSYFSKYISAPL